MAGRTRSSFRLNAALAVEPQLKPAPVDGGAEAAGCPDGEGEQVAGREEPEAALHLGVLEHDGTGDPGGCQTRSQSGRTGRPGAGGEGHESPNGGVGDCGTEITGGARDADGARPAQLVTPDVAPAAAAEAGIYNDWSELNSEAGGGHAAAEFVIVGQIPGDRFKAADFAQSFGAR